MRCQEYCVVYVYGIVCVEVGIGVPFWIARFCVESIAQEDRVKDVHASVMVYVSNQRQVETCVTCYQNLIVEIECGSTNVVVTVRHGY